MTPSLPRAAMVPLMVLAGALVALQSRVNGALADEIGSGLRAGSLAAVVSFGSGLAVISVVVVTTSSGRTSMRRLAHARAVLFDLLRELRVEESPDVAGARAFWWPRGG